MAARRVLVIGGTGTVGSEVLRLLPTTGVQVRALARNPESARFDSRVEVIRGDLTVPETLAAAVEGVDAVFLVWTAPAEAADAALDTMLRNAPRIVLLTAPHKTPHPLFQQSNRMAETQKRIEERIESSGGEWTFVRPGMFASNCVGWWAGHIRAGEVIRWPYLSVPTAPIHPRDIAAVAVRALCDQGHGGAEYVITGPESLTQREQIAVIGRAIGRKIHAEEISPKKARTELLPIFGAPPVIDMLLNAWGAAEGQPAYVTSTVEEVTGRVARTFAEWAAENAEAFRG